MNCSLCKSEIKIAYRLEKYGIKGYVCGSCYSKKIREAYNIK